MDPIFDTASTIPRYCHFYLASDGQWYMEIAFTESMNKSDADTFGPLPFLAEAIQYMTTNFASPGEYTTDDSGEQSIPLVSPSGNPVCPAMGFAK